MSTLVGTGEGGEVGGEVGGEEVDMEAGEDSGEETGEDENPLLVIQNSCSFVQLLTTVASLCLQKRW